MKKRQMMWMWVKICFCIKMNLSAIPSNTDYDFLPTFLMQPDYVNNQKKDCEGKNPNYGQQDVI